MCFSQDQELAEKKIVHHHRDRELFEAVYTLYEFEESLCVLVQDCLEDKFLHWKNVLDHRDLELFEAVYTLNEFAESLCVRI